MLSIPRRRLLSSCSPCLALRALLVAIFPIFIANFHLAVFPPLLRIPILLHFPLPLRISILLYFYLYCESPSSSISTFITNSYLAAFPPLLRFFTNIIILSYYVFHSHHLHISIALFISPYSASFGCAKLAWVSINWHPLICSVCLNVWIELDL